ncbi:MAG TPA: DegT/DnrJ/EryC1/StrS family aminotransferase [Bacteroidales bacterium]|nr:DegT/DnrJ/EryC1/StrS family aminotransferase [Bacteroidales bacterium]HOK73628.1 DegT/DnrJ/EryC1/StrS family aminotransferase [Bacteroidales bacterium]HOM40597.1 DegT/DnrJ/EryC1/StrS family aminotransferase [Bacteroidales bacterium]HPP92124.1 DegT/DnrJ/EryC1/StrS family aminotransferase [Bacteroidales bacterium]HRR17059.1 DegT/DnrJ/EryC1/StrS family aminotransferase [Bacteroidales bacterium]
MKAIQMADLRAQYERLKPEIDKAINEVLLSTNFVKGPEIKKFEDELAQYLGAKHVISCGNGTDALQIAYMALGLKPGDEIITTSFTFIATVETMALLGLKPVFADVDEKTFNISPAEIRKRLTPSTRAIVPVHLFGQCADMEEILRIAEENSLYVIEDTAQATGAEFIFSDGKRKKAGTMGIAGTTSFFPSKNLACYGDGGAIFTDDDELARKMRSIANHGMQERYHYECIGVNSRLDTIQAVILRVKLKYLDSFNEARQKAALFYDEAFASCPEIIIPGRTENSTHIFHQYTIRVLNGKRDLLKKHLQSRNIPTMIYYPLPIHMQKAYRYLGWNEGDLPVTEQLCKEVLSLPICPEIEREQLEYIAKSVLEFF